MVTLDDDGVMGLANTLSSFYLFKTDSLGRVYSNLIKGKVGFDEQPNCQVASNEISLSNWLVTAENDSSSYFSSTDNNGNYSFSLDTGEFVLKIHPQIIYGIPVKIILMFL